MEITGEHRGVIGLKGIKYHSGTGTRIAQVEFRIELNEDEARDMLGDLFATVHEFGFKDFTPTVKLDEHVVEILGVRGKCVPRLAKIRNLQEALVEAEFVLPLPVAESMRSFYGKLCCRVGSMEAITFALLEPELPLTEEPEPCEPPAGPRMVS